MATNPSQFASLGNASLSPPVNLTSGATGNAVFGAAVTGDAFNRVQLDAGGFIDLGTGAGATDTRISRQANGIVNVPGLRVVNNNIDVVSAGQGLAVAEGSNAKQGTAVLVAGTVTVANTAVTASSRIFLTGQVLGGTAGGLNVTSRIAGTSFTITSTNAADTSTVAYQIFEPG